MNTVYNFYSEGVLNRFVLKVQSNSDPDTKFFDSTRAKIYAALFCSIFVFAFWGGKKNSPEEPSFSSL